MILLNPKHHTRQYPGARSRKMMLKTIEYPVTPTRDDAKNDAFLFNQGPTKSLGKIQFHDYNLAYGLYDLPNLNVFREQIAVFKDLLAMATPDEAQQKDTENKSQIPTIQILNPHERNSKSRQRKSQNGSWGFWILGVGI